MTYYPDFSQYVYWSEFQQPNTFNIGWLDESQIYNKGKTSQLFQQRLLEFCFVPMCVTRGWHLCPFCDANSPIELQKGGKSFKLGSAEIRVIGKNDRIFASPNLIYHYVVDHNYCPPDEFVNAVLESPFPNAPRYIERFKNLR